ncbi:MAG: hypothetical protein ABI700_03405 [Chloroflexota bacterium]
MSQNKEWSAFVLMPFDPQFTPIYVELIVPALEEIGYSVERADSFLGQRHILKEIVRKIDLSDLIVAELTTLNANVMYELGIAHALLKPTITIIQDVEELPFDLRPYTTIPYSTRFNEVGKLKDELQKLGQGLQNGSAIFANPVSDFAPSVLQKIQEIILVAQPITVTIDENKLSPTWLDLVGEGVEQLEVVAAVAVRLSAAITEMGQKMTLRTDQLNNVNNSGVANAPAIIYKIVKAVSDDLLVYASQTETELQDFREAWNTFSNNYQLLLINSTISTEEDLQAVSTFVVQLSDFQNILGGTMTSVTGFRDNIRNLPDVSKHIMQARKTAVEAVNHMLEELTIIDSSIARLINITSEMIQIYQTGKQQ